MLVLPTEHDWIDLVLGRAHVHEAEVLLVHLDMLMKQDYASEKEITRKNHQSHIDHMKPTFRTHQVRLTLCSDSRRAVGLYILSRVLPQQVTPWSHASTICAIPSTSQHIPAPLKPSQTATLQIFLRHQDFPSHPNPPVCSHTSETFLYAPPSPGASFQRMIKESDYSV